MAWSGDIFQQVSDGTDLKFVIPEEGGTIWTDNMCIPKTAQNPVDALTLMDYFYQPDDRRRCWPSTSTTSPRCRPPRT